MTDGREIHDGARLPGSLLERLKGGGSDAGGLGVFLSGGATENSLGWNLLTGGGDGPAGAGIHPNCLYLGIGVGKTSIGVSSGIGGGNSDERTES